MRSYPRLIHPIPVEIRQISRTKTKWDDKAREPIGRIVRDNVVQLEAQVRWVRIEQPIADFNGIRHDSKGTLTFRYRDLDEAGITLVRGDKVSKIGNRNTDMFLDHFEDAGNYQDFSGATLLVVTMVDRDPGESTS